MHFLFTTIKFFTTMWSGTHAIVTTDVTKEQMWKLFSAVNNWPSWDDSVEYAHLEGRFESGNHFVFQPKGGPKLKLKIVEATENKSFTDLTTFPLAKMYGEHHWEETPQGLKITTTMKVSGLLGFLWRRLVAQAIVDGLPHDMQHQIQAAKQL